MERSKLALACVFAVLVLGSACYEDARLGPISDDGLTSVLLTDAPFPFDIVDRVEVYVVEIAASTEADTVPGSQDWATIASPRRRFDLLTLQQGTTALLGEGGVRAGLYQAVRMTIDTDSSRVTFKNGNAASVRWPVSGELALHALVEAPLTVPDSGTRIVIDFDVGRSFADFVFIPYIRAVNEAVTGSLSGRVFGDADDDGIPEPLDNAAITVLRGNPDEPAYTWWVSATGHTDAGGSYTVGFLLEGTYIVQVDAPFSSTLGTTTTADITITAGQVTAYSVTLPRFNASSIVIEGPRTMSVGDSTVLRAVVRDASGVIVENPSVRWQSLVPAVASVSDIGEYATVRGWTPGVAPILATSLGLTDSIDVTVSQ